MSRAVLDRLEPEGPSYTQKNTRGDRYLVAPDKTTLVLDQSERNLEELNELHEMILDEKEYDYGAVPEVKHKPFEHYMPDDATHTRGSNTASTATPAPANPKISAKTTTSEPQLQDKENKGAGANISDTTKTLDTPFVEPKKERKLDQVEEDRLSALARENERLKKELGSFDGEFFEQLEDLKHRYSRLQEIVGEDPIGREGGARSSALPLDRLSWSVRNSMTAMDRAGLTSPLVSRPRYPNAHTYAPGGASRDFGASSRGLGSTGGVADESGRGRTTGHVGGRLHATTGRINEDKYSSLSLSRPLYDSRTVDDRNPPPSGNICLTTVFSL